MIYRIIGRLLVPVAIILLATACVTSPEAQEDQSEISSKKEQKDFPLDDIALDDENSRSRDSILTALSDYLADQVSATNSTKLSAVGTTPPGRFAPQYFEIELTATKESECRIFFIRLEIESDPVTLTETERHTDCCDLSGICQRDHPSDWMFHFSRLTPEQLYDHFVESEDLPEPPTIMGPSWSIWDCSADFSEGGLASCDARAPGETATYHLRKWPSNIVRIVGFEYQGGN